MGFLKGFILAIPVGLYFGEKGLRFPIIYKEPQSRDRKWGDLMIDLRFLSEF